MTAVIALGDGARRTLGFLAPAAYEQAAEQGTLLAAVVDGQLAGYTLFGLPRQQVRLTHLCVDPTYRRMGIGRALVDEISRRHRDRMGIVLKCRRDYGLEEMWTSLGFEPRNEVPGRGKDRAPLVVWWRDHGHPDLFTQQEQEQESAALLRVAMDCNVFADLHASTTRLGSQESKGLTAPWLQGLVDLTVLPVLVEEIAKITDGQERRKQLVATQEHPRLTADRAHADAIVQELVTRASERLGLTLPRNENDAFDLRYIAEAAVSGVAAVVTRDDFVLGELKELAASVCQVRVLRPSDIVLHIDELTHAQAYRPGDLLGTSFTAAPIPAGSEEKQVAFLDKPGGERLSAFRAQIRTLAAAPDYWQQRWILDSHDQPVALYGTGVRDGQLLVPLLRTVGGQPLGPTLARQIIFLLRGMARDNHATLLRLTDTHMPKEIRDAAIEDRFQQHNGELVALVLDLCADAAAISTAAHSAAARIGLKVPALTPSLPPAVTSAIERAWWPAKITDSGLATFLVPIRPVWAAELFGVPASLVPRDDRLGISREHVYFRAPRSRGERAPARILWYASADKDRKMSEVIACSRLDGTVVATAGELFTRFRHLGVWTRQNIEDEARRGQGTARALQFSDTEIFPRPVPLRRLRALAYQHRHPLTVQSVFKISSELFSAVYKEGRPSQ